MKIKFHIHENVLFDNRLFQTDAYRREISINKGDDLMQLFTDYAFELLYIYKFKDIPISGFTIEKNGGVFESAGKEYIETNVYFDFKFFMYGFKFIEYTDKEKAMKFE